MKWAIFLFILSVVSSVFVGILPVLLSIFILSSIFSFKEWKKEELKRQQGKKGEINRRSITVKRALRRKYHLPGE
jgi:hypothetical protein